MIVAAFTVVKVWMGVKQRCEQRESRVVDVLLCSFYYRLAR